MARGSQSVIMIAEGGSHAGLAIAVDCCCAMMATVLTAIFAECMLWVGGVHGDLSGQRAKASVMHCQAAPAGVIQK